MPKIVDAVEIAGTRKNAQGYLIADARVARTGIQNYLGIEVDKPDMPIVRVYRPGSEVFSQDSMKSAAHKPVTNNHPKDMVDSTNWKDVAVGQTADEITGQGVFIRVPLMVSDETAIKDIEGGKRELSAGYTCELDFTPGLTDSGEAYDAVQRNIRFNHFAIVSKGRAGKEVRIGDASPWGTSPIIDHQTEEKPMANRTVTVDGIPVEATDQAAIVIETLQKRIIDGQTAMSTAAAAHTQALATKDAELAKKDAEIETLKKGQLTDAQLDERVAKRATLVNNAKLIFPDLNPAGLTDAAIRKTVVTKALGDAAVVDKSDAYLDARFDVLVEDKLKAGGDGVQSTDPFRTAVQQGVHTQQTTDQATVDKSYQEMIDAQTKAWMNPVSTKGAA
jgi:hypothetical protein